MMAAARRLRHWPEQGVRQKQYQTKQKPDATKKQLRALNK
jgi:hypothetical protein